MEEESKDINSTKEATTTTKTLFYYGGEKPPHNTVYLRIYGHPLCINSQKVWMTFKAKRIPYQKVVVDCSNISDWH